MESLSKRNSRTCTIECIGGAIERAQPEGHTSRRRTAPSDHSAFCVWRTRSFNRPSCTFWRPSTRGISSAFRMDSDRGAVSTMRWTLSTPDLPEASELGARFGYPGLFRCHGPFMDDPFSRAPYRGQAHPAPDCEMAEGRHQGRWARNTQ